jgi:hypothetical protein
MPRHTLTVHRRIGAGLAAVLLAVTAQVTVPLVDPGRADVAAASSGAPTAVIVVGPVGGSTPEYRVEAGRIARQLRSYGANVREIYSPWATWARVKEAARGAHLLVYLGRGRGYPSPYGAYNPKSMNGLGLNRVAGKGHSNVAYYGEQYVREGLDLATNAVVILNRARYAAGSSDPGRANPSRRTAIVRADNYAAGFLRAGAAAVFASDRSVSSVVRDLFRSSLTMRSLFWNSPWTSTRYDSAFASKRTPGSSGIVAPYGPGRYYQAVVGRLSWTARSWRGTWAASSTPTVAGSSARVATIPALLTALANNSLDEIVVADGTYRVATASAQAANSLWIGSRFANRTRPITVRAETRGGVTFDGGGTSTFGGISFEEGAHHQTWDGFVFANGSPTQTGVVVFGGYPGKEAPHHVTLRNITLPRSLTSTSSGATDHGVYFSQAVGGPHDILIDGLTVDGAGGLDSAIHFYHSSAGNLNAWNVTIRRLKVTGTEQAIILWDPTIRDITIDTATIAGAQRYAVRYESPGATGITLANITSTGSGSGQGFHSSLGATPPGVTFTGNSLR